MSGISRADTRTGHIWQYVTIIAQQIPRSEPLKFLDDSSQDMPISDVAANHNAHTPKNDYRMVMTGRDVP